MVEWGDEGQSDAVCGPRGTVPTNIIHVFFGNSGIVLRKLDILNSKILDFSQCSTTKGGKTKTTNTQKQ